MPPGFFQIMETPLPGRFSLRGVLVATGAVLMGLSWLNSLHFLPWVSWHSESAAFAAVLVLAWSSFLPSSAGQRANVGELPPAAIPFACLGVAVVIQAALGLITFWGDALVLLLYLALCIAALMIGFGWCRNRAQGAYSPTAHIDRQIVQGVAFTLLMGAVASALIALVQALGVWSDVAWIQHTEYTRRPGANLGQPNQLATLLLMGVASLLYFYESRRLSSFTAGIVFVVLGMGLAVTESRTGVLSFLTLCGWWLVGRNRAGLRMSSWAALIAAVSLVGLFAAWPTLMSSVDILESGAAVDTRPGMRLVVWPQLLDALAMRPWSGWGLREVAKAQNAVASSYALSEPYTYCHNILLDLALGLGVPLALLATIVTGVWLWRRVSATRSLVPWYCLAALLPLAVHSMLEFPFAYAYFLVPAMFLIGVLEATTEAQPPFRIGPVPLGAGLLLMTVLGSWTAVEYLRIEEDFRVARFEALQVGRTRADYQRPQIVLLSQLDALVRGARIAPHPGMSAKELELARKVALHYPWPATQNRYALSLVLNGNPTEGLRQIKVLRALHGEKEYREIQENWQTLAQTKYPTLKKFMPL